MFFPVSGMAIRKSRPLTEITCMVFSVSGLFISVGRYPTLCLVGNGLHNLGLQFFAQLGIVAQQLLGAIAPLCQLRVLV